MIKNNKGFTLIELLVVVAIIGILSSVVLASLNNARSKGADASIKSNLANMRSQAAIYYETNNGWYSSVAITTLPVTSCTTGSSVFSDSTLASMIAAVTSANTAPTCVLGGTSAAKASSWAIYATLKTTGSWCVDSTGASVSGTDSNADGDCGA